MEPDYYEVLGVEPEAAREEIKASYRLAVREHHPDAAPAHLKEAAHERIQLIIAAWTVLGEPASRVAYDERRRRAQAQAPHGPPDGPLPPGLGGRGEGAGGRKKSRVAAVMGGTSSPRPINPRTRLLAMVFDAAQLYHVEGRPDEAARVCQQVLRADPTNAEAAVLLSDIYASQNQRAAALDLLERALRLQPSNVMYRSKWEALRHSSPGSARPSAPPPPPAASRGAGGANPWSKAGPASPLASRIAERAAQGPSEAPADPDAAPAPDGGSGGRAGGVEDLPAAASASEPTSPSEERGATAAAEAEPRATEHEADAAPEASEPRGEPEPPEPPEPRSSLLQRLRSRLSR